MGQVVNLSIILDAPPPGSPPDAIARVELQCEEPHLTHSGYLLTKLLTNEEHEGLRWYLEEYWKWPYLEFAARGKQVEAMLREIGKRLYHTIFGSVEAQGLLEEWRKQPDGQHQISVVSELPEVLSLPWELLHDAYGFLALRREQPISIVRRLPRREQPAHSMPFARPLRVLLVSARPEGTGFIDPRGIAHELLDEIQGQVEAGAIEIEFVRPPTFSALNARLSDRKRPIHMLHFDGHGAFSEERHGQGVLIFETEAGWANPVKASDLARVLRDSGVRLVLLTACQSATSGTDTAFSSVAAQLIYSGADAVVAMSASVLVASATRYVEALYRELVAGVAVPIAQERARQALHDDPRRHAHRHRRDEEGRAVELVDWWLPHLYQHRPVILQPMSTGQGSTKPQEVLSSHRLSEQMPAAPRYGFTGRARELLQIERALMRGKLVVISGFGGIGKTALAREAADWLTRTRMYDGACFVSFEHRGDTVALLSVLGHYLGVYDGYYNPHDSKAALMRLRPVLKEKRTAVIADNLESVLPSGETPLEATERTQLWDILLELVQMGAGILLTSQDGGSGEERLASGKRVMHLQLQGLNPEDAYALATRLLDDLEIDRSLTPYAELRDLLVQLDHHPLAIQLVLPALREVPLSAIGNNFTEHLPKYVDD